MDAVYLTVYTPTYKRPIALSRCKTSVNAQTLPTQHIVIEDTVGIGIPAMYEDIRNHTDGILGEYVLVLSDDCFLLNRNFSELLRNIADIYDQPDVIMFKNKIANIVVQPDRWGDILEGHVDLSTFVVKRDLWIANADKWGARYSGDFDFINVLWQQHLKGEVSFFWWDSVQVRALRISQGKSEEEMGIEE